MELKEVAKGRLEDSIVLAIFDRYDGAIYLCGYALEIALKVKASKVNGYSDFPETAVEFKDHQRHKLKTHNLNSLLTLSGLDLKSDKNQFKCFNIVAANWVLSIGTEKYLVK